MPADAPLLPAHRTRRPRAFDPLRMMLTRFMRRRYWLAPVLVFSGCRLRQLLTRSRRSLAASCSQWACASASSLALRGLPNQSA